MRKPGMGSWVVGTVMTASRIMGQSLRRKDGSVNHARAQTYVLSLLIVNVILIGTYRKMFGLEDGNDGNMLSSDKLDSNVKKVFGDKYTFWPKG